MKMKINDAVSSEIKDLEDSLIRSINSDIGLATEVSSHLVNAGGKRIRPLICILTAKAFGYSGKELIQLASAIELLHTATLIHDDVVDESISRRGKESIHRKWDNAHGVLVGDFVYSKAFQLMADLKDSQIIKILADSTNIISEGEVLQLSLKSKELISEDDYFEIIGRKTAELFKASSRSAAVLSEASHEEVESVGDFAYSLGIAFQIQDDLLDYFGNEKVTGKKIGKDFLEGRITLPLLTEENRQKLVKLVGEKMEQARIAMRIVRDKVKDEIKEQENAKELTEDDKYRLIEELDLKIKEYNKKIEEIGKAKEEEIMTI